MFRPEFYIKFKPIIYEIYKKYSNPQRLWHGTTHISTMVIGYNNLVKNKIIKYNENDILAILYHDIVYIPGSSYNEEKSSELMKSELAKYSIDTSYIEKVILGTKTHQTLELHNSDFIFDLDMAIFSCSPDLYNLYVSAIRFEYSYMKDTDWKKQRNQFLNRLLRQGIFITKYFIDIGEETAQFNIKRELNF